MDNKINSPTCIKRDTRRKCWCIRKGNVLIGGASHRPPDHVVVPELMERFVETVENEWSTCIR